MPNPISAVPSLPGNYSLKMGVEEEGIFWFSSLVLFSCLRTYPIPLCLGFPAILTTHS